MLNGKDAIDFFIKNFDINKHENHVINNRPDVKVLNDVFMTIAVNKIHKNVFNFEHFDLLCPIDKSYERVRGVTKTLATVVADTINLNNDAEFYHLLTADDIMYVLKECADDSYSVELPNDSNNSGLVLYNKKIAEIIRVYDVYDKLVLCRLNHITYRTNYEGLTGYCIVSAHPLLFPEDEKTREKLSKLFDNDDFNKFARSLDKLMPLSRALIYHALIVASDHNYSKEITILARYIAHRELLLSDAPLFCFGNNATCMSYRYVGEYMQDYCQMHHLFGGYSNKDGINYDINKRLDRMISHYLQSVIDIYINGLIDFRH